MRNSECLSPILEFHSPAMKDFMEIALRAASSNASILLTGESGTGKGVLAKAIHQRSHLADKPLVTISCPSLSRELLESELFGHVRGSFTGALRDHWGKVKEAAGGTLFLDEIGDLPMEIQPKLLRLLQEGEYERVGENKTRLAETRIIAATSRDLKKQMAAGIFREDLYFRLNVITLHMPPLRERREDLPRFAYHFLQHFTKQCRQEISDFTSEAVQCILNYAWPGNLRELRNVVERAVIVARHQQIIPADFPGEILAACSEIFDLPEIGAQVSMEKLGEMHLRKVLEKNPCLSQAAAILGINRATLYRMRKRMGLN